MPSTDAVADPIFAIIAPTSPLKHLWIELGPSCSVDGVESLLKGLAHRDIALTSFHLDVDELDEDTIEINGGLSEFLRSQCVLERVGLPYYYGTVEIFAALGGIQSLREIYLTSWCGRSTDATQYDFVGGTFPRLQSFAWADLNLLRATDRLRGVIPPHLSSVSLVTCDDGSTNAELSAFLEALVETVPRLEEVSLCHFSDSEERKTFNAIQSLLRCKNLRKLQIKDTEPMVLREEDVARMAEAWPRLHTLVLTPDPIKRMPPDVGSPLSILSVFARLFDSSLLHLGLYLKRDQDGLSRSPSVFALTNLRTLSVGTSPMTGNWKMDYVIFLAGLFPNNVAIQAGLDPSSRAFVVLESRWWVAAEQMWADIEAEISHVNDHQRYHRYELEMAKREIGILRLKLLACESALTFWMPADLNITIWLEPIKLVLSQRSNQADSPGMNSKKGPRMRRPDIIQ